VALSSIFEPSVVRPSGIQATGQASVKTRPTTVLAGSAEPSGAQNR
jgi:hypothetical protein